MRKDIMGVTFDDVTLEEAVQTGVQLLAEPGLSYVVTPNPEIVNAARGAEDYRDLLNKADLVLADGIGVVYASKILGRPLKGRVPGVDFAAGLLAHMARTGERLFLLGAKPGVAKKAAENLTGQYPGLVICGTHHGYFRDSGPVAEAIRASKADAVFVCLGAPKQERWMAEYGKDTGARLMIGLGGVLDLYAGNVKRAPELWQKAGMEWLYRLIRQPSRAGRMAKLPLFLVDASAQRRKERS